MRVFGNKSELKKTCRLPGIGKKNQNQRTFDSSYFKNSPTTMGSYERIDKEPKVF